MSNEYKRIRISKDTNTRTNDVRNTADNITNELDRQAVENFELNLQVNKYRSELKHALQQLDEHSYCPGEVDIQCKNNECDDKCKIEQVIQDSTEPQHGPDCHCSKCCPNPNPNFFQRHRIGILVSILWAALIILGIGWTPSGGVFDAIQNSWVQLFVNFFKVGIFAIAGIVSYQLFKHHE
jgi:hypothetical protein